MRYLKRHCNESRGDEYDSWGISDWLFETDNDGYVTRCIQRYQNANVLLYTGAHTEDKCGTLPEGALDLADFQDYAIAKTEFEEILNSVKPISM